MSLYKRETGFAMSTEITCVCPYVDVISFEGFVGDLFPTDLSITSMCLRFLHQ